MTREDIVKMPLIEALKALEEAARIGNEELCDDIRQALVKIYPENLSYELQKALEEVDQMNLPDENKRKLRLLKEATKNLAERIDISQVMSIQDIYGWVEAALRIYNFPLPK